MSTSHEPDDAEPVAFSNAVRLKLREWLVVGGFGLLLFFCSPALWKQVEPLPVEANYRLPHELGDDYWLWERDVDQAVNHYEVLVLGDSVVWGEYVGPGQTLPAHLNVLAGKERCANLGLVGAHPLALGGLIEHYGRSITNKRVVLVCNPLWLSSPQADLQDDKATGFNHPRLLPQFSPRIPPYKAEISPRLGVLVEEHTPLSAWTNHLQQAYYNHSDLPAWTLEHPYENPLQPLTRGLPALNDTPRHPSQPWYKSGFKQQDYPWVELNTSLQWPAFQRLVQLLRQLGNPVFVVVGPFNEHLLTAPSLQRYRELKAGIASWLEAQQIPHLVAEALPSDEYGDSSHPLARGYERLARQLQDLPQISE